MKRILLALGLILAGAFTLQAAGTTSGTEIINGVTATFSNAGAVKFTETAGTTNTVRTVYGLSGTETTNTLNAAPGATVAFPFTVANNGNSSAVVNLRNVFSATNESIHNGLWTWTFYQDVGLTIPVTELELAEDASQTFYLALTAPAGAEDGAAITNKFGSILTNADSLLAEMGFYTSMDASTVFGGYKTLTNNIAIAVISAPRLILSKTSDVSNSASYLALATAGYEKETVPGSQITYAISWTNAGSGDLYGLTLTDTIPAETDYVPGSIKYSANGQFTASGANYLALPGTLADDGLSTPGAGDFNIRGRENTGAIEIWFEDAIPGNASGSIMYQVIVK